MIITKGTLCKVISGRKGMYYGIAREQFDTEEEWYSMRVAKRNECILNVNGVKVALTIEPQVVFGINTDWYEGDEIPCRNGLDRVEPLNNETNNVLESIKIKEEKGLGTLR